MDSSSPSFELQLENANNSPISVDLSWEFTPGTKPVDMDASAVVFSSTGGLLDAAYYNQLKCCEGRVTHSGDGGAGAGSNSQTKSEKIHLDLNSLHGVSAILILISCYKGGTLQDCESSFCQINQGTKELANFSSGCSKKTGMLLCMIFKHPDTMKWHFKKLQEPVNARHFVACIPKMREIVDAVLDPGVILERQLKDDKTFQMEKGQGLFLPPGCNHVTVGLGWDTKKDKNIDLDASCLALADVDNDGDLDPIDVAYFGKSSMPGVQTTGDNTSGEGDGDDESLIVNLLEVDKTVTTLAFCVNIYTSGASFGDVQNAYIRLYNTKNKHVYAKYDLKHSDLGANRGVIFCFIQRTAYGQPWSLLSIGEPCGGGTVKSISTPLWDGTYAETGSSNSAQAAGEGCCIII